jgi:hypothetical protein
MEKSLEMLPKIIGFKNKRSVELIADFTDRYAKNWGICVPSYFLDALDIKLTDRIIKKDKLKLLTQGSAFNFAVGDTFYNHAHPYCNHFINNNKLEQPPLCISVESSTPCIPENNNNSRNTGMVYFKILINRGKNQSECCWETIGHKTLTQDEFVELLIRGIPIDWLNKK